MHIPDGYIGPQTYAAAYAVTVPFWVAASRIVGRTLRSRQVPMLALGAAFSFVIMMFNVPAPGGTTGHAVGAVLVAVLLGPWAACIAVTVALTVQALLFGDGGITALGANCLNMAVIMPFVGYGIYRLIAGRSEATSWRRWLGAAVGGYVGLNVAAVVTAVQFGIQPLIAHDAAGRALYAPYPLKVAVPVMAAEHLLLFGFVEAVVTGMVVAYLQKADPSLLVGASPVKHTRMGAARKLWIGLAALILLSPLGLIVPAKFGAGSAWGEWSAEELQKLVGYVPSRLSGLGGLWKSLMPDYALPGQESAPTSVLSFWYVVSAVVGVAVLVLLVLLIGRILARHEHSDAA